MNFLKIKKLEKKHEVKVNNNNNKKGTMNDSQAQAQIAQMKGFILKEAEEKRDELLAKANEECAIERQKIVLQEKKKIQQDYDRKVREREREI